MRVLKTRAILEHSHPIVIPNGVRNLLLLGSANMRIPRAKPKRRKNYAGTRALGMHQFLQRRPVADDQVDALQLYEFLLLELREQPADGFARRANHFSDFLMGQR